MRVIAISSLLAIAAISMIASGAGRAYAQAFDACVDECVNESGCYGSRSENDQSSDTCTTAQIDCEQSCRSKSGNGAHQLSYGAIARSGTSHDFGWSKDYSSRSAAEQAAVARCVSSPHHSQDCKSVLWFSNNCGALAEAPNGAAGWDYAKSAGEANSKAMATCLREGGMSGCVIRVSDCTP